MHTHYTTTTDGVEYLAQCDTCHEHHRFKSPYFARQWMNRHGQMFARSFCVCHLTPTPSTD